MAGNTRFDSSAASPEDLASEGNFVNGQKRNLINGSLEKSKGLHKDSDGQLPIPNANVSQGNSTYAGDAAPLDQSLILDPITMGDQRYTRPSELRRVLGMSFGATLEDCAFGNANLNSHLPVAPEKVKQFKACVQEASEKARYNSKTLDESLNKLNKCWEAVNLKRKLQNELLPNERMGGSHLSKTGNQTHQSPTETANQRLEDRPKNVILNKRVHTSAAEIQAEGQNNSFARQPSANGKGRDNIRDGGKFCDVIKEKIQWLPANGETWNNKMKRKRSMGTVFARSIDGEGEPKKVMHSKPANESCLQFSDAQSLRSGYQSSNSRLDIASLPANSNACVSAKNEQEKASRDSMDANEEQVVLKGKKLNVHDNNYTGGINTLAKGKASRPPRAGRLIAGNSEETLEALEQPSNVNTPPLIIGTVNHKHAMPEGSSLSHMTQWVGQRSQRISRTRRANVVSPILNCEEVPVPLEGCSLFDVGTNTTSTRTSGSLISKGAIKNIQIGRMKHDNDSSPTKLSESEESGAGENGENKLKEKGLEKNKVDTRDISNSYNISSSMSVTKGKEKLNIEEIGDGMCIPGRGSTGRSSSVLKTGISSRKEKLEISTLAMPIQNMKPASEKNRSRSGRPPLPPRKKSCNRKANTRLGRPTSNSSNIAGKPDDDREELLAASNFASNASYNGCSSSFRKKMEPYFAPVNLEDIAYMKQLVKTAEVDQKCLSQMLCLGSASDGVVLSDNLPSQSSLEGEREKSILNQTDLKEMSSMVDIIDQHHGGSFLCRQIDSEGNKVTPLYQRVLSALIIDDQTDEETVGDGDGNKSVPCERDDSPLVDCFSQDVENRSNIRRTDCGFDTNMVSCNGNATCGTNIHVQELDSLLQVGQGPLHPKTRSMPMLSENGSDGLMGMYKSPCSSSVELHYEQMSMEDRLLLELQSVGLYPEEAVPGLADGDYDAIDQEIIQLQNGLSQQLIKKREHLMKVIQAAEESREMEQRALEQGAMDKLVELAYKKKLATRGSSAARYGLPKVSRPVASAFLKRTLARCRKFEETGKSCFQEPVLKNILFATPARDNNADSAVAKNLPVAQNSQKESALPGSFPCKKQNVSGSPEDPSETGFILNKGKEKEKEAPVVNSFVDGAKGKMNEKEGDIDNSGRGVKSRGKSKTKAKAKSNAAQLSTSANGSLGKLVEDTNSELPIETEEPLKVDPIEELAAANELDGNQDMDFLANIDDADLDGEDFMGLCIPMDDLSDLNIVP